MKAAGVPVSLESVSLERILPPGTFMFPKLLFARKKARFLLLVLIASFAIMLLCSECKSGAI